MTAALAIGCRPARPPAVSPHDSVALPTPTGNRVGEVYTLVHLENLHGYNAMHEPARLVVRDSATWVSLWPRISGAEVDAAGRPVPAPSVDFGRDMLLVAALGVYPSLGPRITIDSVYVAGDRLTAVVRAGFLDFGCLVASAATAPVDVVRVPRDPRPVTFVERRVTIPNCGGPSRP